MTKSILCIGSVLWDVIGRSASHMRVGSDVPGRITRIPGGVAMNIAMTLRRFGLTPILLTSIGRDAEGDELIAEAARMGIETGFTYRSEDLPTDVYMAIEGANGLIAAIADAHSLEAADDKILRPLTDGRLASDDAPYQGVVALDGNLTTDLLSRIAQGSAFADTDLRIAPASPGKANRLLALISHPRATFYVNREEAGLLCQRQFDDAITAAVGLGTIGVRRALVTDGGNTAAEMMVGQPLITSTPPEVMVTRVTGAGDTFMAAHIANEIAGLDRQTALSRALEAAANYVAGDTSL
ncbi:MAG: kinase [Marivivens sp.]|nr:kinase [Marivivens sp.]